MDKNVLPNPKHISYEKYVAPRDETERYISGIFQEILRVNRVGIDDSFFELGGHSLRAIRLVNMLEQKYGTRIPLRKILENSTVRKLSEEVKRDANREQHVPIKKQPEKITMK
ncbi:phosphopantetheine-binding protein [Bacillus cereus]